MDEAAITQYITDTFDGLDLVVAGGTSFFFNDPGRDLPVERRLPFATIVTSNAYDDGSDLDRPGVFRLNVGVGKQTFESLFGPATTRDGVAFDLTALDQIMPHPEYGKMFWVCVLNPSEATFERVKPMLAEAFELAGRQAARLRRA